MLVLHLMRCLMRNLMPETTCMHGHPQTDTAAAFLACFLALDWSSDSIGGPCCWNPPSQHQDVSKKVSCTYRCNCTMSRQHAQKECMLDRELACESFMLHRDGDDEWQLTAAAKVALHTWMLDSC